MLLLGHADLIHGNTLEELKEFNKNLKIAQWFELPLKVSGPDYRENTKKVLDKLDFIDNTFVTTSPDVLDFDVNETPSGGVATMGFQMYDTMFNS